MRFEYKKAKDGNWYWHLKAKNGEIIAQGEAYANKKDCLHAIELIQSSSEAPVIDVTSS